MYAFNNKIELASYTNAEVRAFFEDIKESNPEDYVKWRFRELMMKPQEQQQIFNTIWANNLGLRQSLFPINNTPELKPDALSEFIQMVNTLDNKLFNFIKVK